MKIYFSVYVQCIFVEHVHYLAAWTLLSIPLAVFEDAGPVTQQLVSFPVVSTLQAFVPGCMAFKTPDKLALRALNL